MANEVKWIKIMTDIFDDEKMCAIESLPDGLIMELVWFKILCLAGKCNNNGFLYVANKIAYTDEMLAKIFRMEIGVVQRALTTFQDLEMIEVVDNTYMISNWTIHQNQNGLDDIREKNRLRQQKFRDRQKALTFGENPICAYCGDTATEIDHIVPKSKGGKDIESNKVFACRRCNSAKNDKDLADFLNMQMEYIDQDLVDSNSKLKKFVVWDNVTSRYVTLQRNVTSSISISNSNSLSFSNSIKEIIDYLNIKTNKRYTYSNKSINRYITGRLNDGFTIDDFKTVIDKKYDEWIGTEFEQYLKPTTLFAPSHFEEYLNQPEKKKKDTAQERRDLVDSFVDQVPTGLSF